jgi:hypothetical protein
MSSIFVLRQDVTPSEIQDAIDERMVKLKGIVGCLLNSTDVPQETVHDAIFAIDGYLEELECLQNRLVAPQHHHSG